VIANGSQLGHIGIQCMRAMNAATLIVVDSNEAALDLAPSIGADHTVQVDKDGLFVEKVMKLTQGKGAASVIDFVAESGSTKTGVKMVRRAGNYYVVGYGENLDIPTIDIISTEINFVGNLVGSYNDLAELMVLAVKGKVKLHTSKYKLADYERAVQDLRDGKVRGRAILVP
jgi:NAD+-dependent secondary alcohol dehydrogenase Adh1